MDRTKDSGGQRDEETEGKIWEVPSARVRVPVYVDVTLPVSGCVCKAGSCPDLVLLAFLWRLHHMGMIERSLAPFSVYLLLKKMVGEAKNSKLLIMAWSFW